MSSVRDEFFADLIKWIGDHHPDLAGLDMRSFAWEYDLSTEIGSNLHNKLNDIIDELADADVCGQFFEFDKDDVACLTERVYPPEGFAYVTVMKDGKRFGVNVPKEAFQK